ncbi:MAG: four-carbon acid sugar kinase family protein [Prevotella sp.]|nr:four-carbon acid sugar kinase family protein [Prevotella sp.]
MKNIESRNKTVVIADDITGAAEIAGVALQHGVSATLTTNISSIPKKNNSDKLNSKNAATLNSNSAALLPDSDIFIVATDTRSGSEEDARKVIGQIANGLKDFDCQIFKKTDSILRGHIVAELQTLIDIIGFDCALLLPQNPSKGRIISNGRYFINNIPLDKTDFRNDPEFPAHSSYIENLLKGNAVNISIKTLVKTDKTIQIADATNAEEIKTQLQKVENKNVLLAGGADFFDSFLSRKYPENISVKVPMLPNPHYSIIVCGSTQSKSIANEKYIKGKGAHECVMPNDVFNGGSSQQWLNELSDIYRKSHSIILTIGQRENAGSEYAVRLRIVMADVVRQLVALQQPDLMIIEGGATAFACLNDLGWDRFVLKNAYAPGIVSMTYDKTEIILKPGSYPWGTLFK